ncbi:collagen-like protein, partial [Patescibacteria group bacterium]|nr:collagen-like protein [Patescibacteria group bacterium]
MNKSNTTNRKVANGNGYISLADAAELCSYSQDYLSLLARRGILKSKKFGRNWFTRKEWLIEYVREHPADKKGNVKGELFDEQEDKSSLKVLWLNLSLQKLYNVIIIKIKNVIYSKNNIITKIKNVGSKKFAYIVNYKLRVIIKKICNMLAKRLPSFFIWKKLNARKIVIRSGVLGIFFCLSFSLISAKVLPMQFSNFADSITKVNHNQINYIVKNFKFINSNLREIKFVSVNFSEKIFYSLDSKLDKQSFRVAGAQDKKINLDFDTELVNNFWNKYKLAGIKFLSLPKDSGEIVKKSVITKWLHTGAWSQQNPAHQISQNLLDGSSEVSRIVKVCANKIFKASNQFANIVVKNIFNPLANSGESIGNEMLKVAQNFGETIFNTLMPWTKYYSDTQDAIMKLAKRKSGLTTLVYQGDYIVQQTPGQPVDSTGKDVIVIKGQKGQSGEKGDVGEKGERGEQGLQGLAGQSGDTFVSNIYNVGSPGTTAKQGAGTVFDAKYLGAGELSVSGGTSLNTLTVGGAASFESSVSIAGGLAASGGLSTSNISGSGYLSIGTGTSDWALEVGDGYFSDDLEVDGSLRVDSATTTGVALLVTSSTAIPQITARYDTDHQWQSSVDNKGNLVWNLTSATNTPEFTFSDPVNISTSIPLGIDVFDITASTTQSIIDIKSSSTDYLIKVDQMGDGGIFDFKQSELSVLSLSNAGVLNLQNASSTQSIFSLTASSSAPLVVFDQKGAGGALQFASSPQASSTISLLQLTANPMALGSGNGTFIAANPASFSGNFLDFQVAGIRYFSLASDGDIFTAGGFLMSVNSTTAVSIQ